VKITSAYLLSSYLKAKPSSPGKAADRAQRSPSDSRRAEIERKARETIAVKHQQQGAAGVSNREREFIQQLFSTTRRMEDEETLGFLGRHLDIKA
jgi:hypothetical protein